jgi:hypothetical protein
MWEKLEVDATALALPVTVAGGLGPRGTPDFNGLLRCRDSQGSQVCWRCWAWGRFGR